MTNVVPIETPEQPRPLSRITADIATVGRRTVQDTFRLADLFHEAKDACVAEDVPWLEWLAEQGVAERTARRYLQTGQIGRSRRDDFKTAADVFEFVSDDASSKARTGDDEWYTPEDIIEAARAVMGGIDLDPATCAVAQRVVRAARYFTSDDDGLAQPWTGRVWMNPPYTSGLKRSFVEKLAESFASGTVSQAVMICSADTAYLWADPIRAHASAKWECDRPTKFHRGDPSDKSVKPQGMGQTVYYFGPHVDEFREIFEALGGRVW